MFAVNSTRIPGCYELISTIREDARGKFVKTYHKEFFASHGLAMDFREEYYTVSNKGVLRGLHFQMPPMAHAKLVYCTQGFVLDAVLDLRLGSPTYGEHQLFELSVERANQIYIPVGLAHGFYVPDTQATMVYNVTSIYSEVHDVGIRWNSAGIPWPDYAPFVSARDAALPPLSEFRSPFNYSPSP